VITDRDSKAWWEALAGHQLLLQQCAGCGVKRWPPRALCNRCGATDSIWARASATGTVASWIVNHHSFGPGPKSPYVVVLVRLDDQDDVLMPGWYDGPPDGSGLALNMPVVVGFDDVGDSALLRWRAVH
jgi:uncharacterized OB-fold protein